jgi:hypothetical protein
MNKAKYAKGRIHRILTTNSTKITIPFGYFFPLAEMAQQMMPFFAFLQ